MHLKKIIGGLKSFSLLALAFCWQPVSAQFTIGSEIRPRFEYREGYRRMPDKGEKPAAFVYQRSRISLEYQKDRISTHLSLQDVRVWGQDPQKVHSPSLDIHQAWIELNLGENLALKAGRQELRYDNQRFFAINNWIMPGQKHDLLLVKHQTQGMEWHLGTAFNQSGALINQNMPNFGTDYPVDNYKYMNFLWFNTALSDAIRLSLLGIADGYENQTTGNLHVRGTWSAYAVWDFNGLNLMVNPAIQHGKTVHGQDIAAHYFRAEARLNPFPKWRTVLGLEYFSGNDFTQEDDETFRVFDPTHGAGHANNGYMDYFTNIPAHTRGAGLVNAFLKNRLIISNTTYLDADLHLFSLAKDYVHEQQVVDRYLGTEVDLTMGYRLNDFTQFSLGYSVMFGTETMEIIRGGSRDRWAHWGFVMLTVNPVLFRSASF
jgi:hypothetical protein